MNFDTGDSIVSAVANFKWEKEDDFIYLSYSDIVYNSMSHNYSHVFDSINYSCEDSIYFRSLKWYRY